MKIVTIVGARPQFIKAAPVSAALRRVHQEVLVHTGQHYDANMSAVFFEQLGLPAPDFNLEIGSGPHGVQTGAMLAGVEALLDTVKPDAVLVYGDTNSTLAGALAAAKLHIPVAHVEAGLRSFNREMPEEVNRVVTDHLSTWLFAPSSLATEQLRREGIVRGIFETGDVMHDAVLLFSERATARGSFPEGVNVEPGRYYLCTIHRAENADRWEVLQCMLIGLGRLDAPVVFPCHPRTARRIEEHKLSIPSNVKIVDPVGYLDMIQLQQNAACVLTDSGGMQKEAYYLGVPCVTLRNETEWRETVTAGWNVIGGTSPDGIVRAVAQALAHPQERPNLYGRGDAAEQIATVLTDHDLAESVPCVESLASLISA